jgi:hypothetical protein
MRVISRLVLIGSLAVASVAVTVTPAQAVRPGLKCEYLGMWYNHGWAGELEGRWMECAQGVWHMM